MSVHNSPPPLDSPSCMQPPAAQRFGSPYAIKHEFETFSVSDTYVAETSDYAGSVGRYFKQKKSLHGKVAYVVYSGNEVGVFYNWTAASMAISGLEDASKVYKGYISYHDAHSAWDEFAYPIPPILSMLPLPLVPPTTPKLVHAYNCDKTSPITSPTLFTPHGGHTVATLSSSHVPANTGNCLNTIRPIVLPSALGTPTSMESRNAAATILHEEAS